ncbi:hypothetical protein C8R43DRAFT_369634 [Mycena crocata]|nr:hypothetical protein C8R43DRAFT_369634 [Mycena crocata]
MWNVFRRTRPNSHAHALVLRHAHPRRRASPPRARDDILDAGPARCVALPLTTRHPPQVRRLRALNPAHMLCSACRARRITGASAVCCARAASAGRAFQVETSGGFGGELGRVPNESIRTNAPPRASNGTSGAGDARGTTSRVDWRRLGTRPAASRRQRRLRTLPKPSRGVPLVSNRACESRVDVEARGVRHESSDAHLEHAPNASIRGSPGASNGIGEQGPHVASRAQNAAVADLESRVLHGGLLTRPEAIRAVNSARAAASFESDADSAVQVAAYRVPRHARLIEPRCAGRSIRVGVAFPRLPS